MFVCLFIDMENVTVGGLLLTTSLIGAGTSLTTLIKRRYTSLAVLAFSDATFTAVLGFALVAQGLNWIQWSLAIFCATLCQAQHSNLTMVAYLLGTRGLKLSALTLLSWVVPTMWTSLLVALPQSYNQNQRLVVSSVNKIYCFIQHNRTRRLFDELKPIWFEETYDESTENFYDEQRNISDILTRHDTWNESSNTTTPQIYFPEMNMTLMSPTWRQCEEPSAYLVLLVFVSYVLPILLISTLNIQKNPNDFQVNILQRNNGDQITPVPRPRSAPPSINPRPRVQSPRYQISTRGKYRLIRALIVISAITFAPGLVNALLHVQSQTSSQVLQLSAISLHTMIKTMVHVRLLSAPQVRPT